jgi:hypothetical protein
MVRGRPVAALETDMPVGRVNTGNLPDAAVRRVVPGRPFRALPKGDALDHLGLADVHIAPVRKLIGVKRRG